MYNNSTVKLALSASGHAFGVRASTEMWVLLLYVRLAAHVSFARHGRALAGESPEHAQVVGRI